MCEPLLMLDKGDHMEEHPQAHTVYEANGSCVFARTSSMAQRTQLCYINVGTGVVNAPLSESLAQSLVDALNKGAKELELVELVAEQERLSNELTSFVHKETELWAKHDQEKKELARERERLRIALGKLTDKYEALEREIEEL